jgi:hypothetical protein
MYWAESRCKRGVLTDSFIGRSCPFITCSSSSLVARFGFGGGGRPSAVLVKGKFELPSGAVYIYIQICSKIHTSMRWKRYTLQPGISQRCRSVRFKEDHKAQPCSPLSPQEVWCEGASFVDGLHLNMKRKQFAAVLSSRPAAGLIRLWLAAESTTMLTK